MVNSCKSEGMPLILERGIDSKRQTPKLALSSPRNKGDINCTQAVNGLADTPINPIHVVGHRF